MEEYAVEYAHGGASHLYLRSSWLAPRSLVKQLTELRNAVRYLSEYRESCLPCLTETWLKETIDNSTHRITGFSDPIRLDRDTQVTSKKLGGGVCVYINEGWCNDYTLLSLLGEH